MKSSEVSVKTRSTPASLTIQGQVTKDTTVKWSITVCTAQSRVLFSLFVQSRPQSRVPFGQRHGTKALAMSNEIPVLIG